MEGIILEEVEELVQTLRKTGGKPLRTTHAFNLASFNLIWKILAGQRFSHDDPTLFDHVKDFAE